MSQDWTVDELEEQDPDRCPSLTRSGLGQAAAMGLLGVSAFTVLTVLVNSAVYTLVSAGAGYALYTIGSSIDMSLYMAIFALVMLCLIASQIIPLASAAAGVYTAVTMHRGGRRASIYVSAIGSFLGPLYLIASSLMTFLFTGVVGVLMMMASLIAVIVSATSVLATLVAVNNAMSPQNEPLPDR